MLGLTGFKVCISVFKINSNYDDDMVEMVIGLILYFLMPKPFGKKILQIND